jgi:hypothetical protein
MKTLWTIIFVLVLATVSQAAPFMVCDPNPGATSYQLTGPAWVPTTVTAQADGSIKLDVAASTIGANNLTVKACNSVWGCSTAVPFAFTRPAAISVPGGLELVP